MKNTASTLCLVLLLCILPVAAPSSAKRAPSPILPADQAAAVGCLRSINTAETYYGKQYQTGFSTTLPALGVPENGAQPSAAAAGLLDNSLTSGTKNGYVFTYTAGAKDSNGKITAYTAIARPVTWKKGALSFFTDETGVLRWTDEDRAPKATDAPF